MSGAAAPDGILLVDKPEGLTSAGVVRDVKRRLGGAKVGHLGTLDPFATGLLPLAIGEGAKVVPYLNDADKAYVGEIRLGVETDTLDRTGRTTSTAPVPALDREALDRAAAAFTGEIEQRPPAYSAIKRDGVPLYELARLGQAVEPPPRTVRIDRLRLEPAGEDRLAVEVECSKGTYVRSLARDLAVALGTVGHLAALRRTGFGPLRVEQAVALAAVGAGDLPILSPRDALGDLREFAVGEAEVERLRRGQQALLGRLPPPRPGEIAKVLGPHGTLVAVLQGSGPGGWRIGRVLNAPPPGTAVARGVS